MPMNGRQRFASILSTSGALLCLAGGWGLAMGAAVAQSQTLQLNLPNLDAPGNRQSGSTRSEQCVAHGEAVTALMPTTNYGQTTDGYPTFFFHLPETTAEVAQFVLYDEASLELVYEGTFAIQGESGIVSISLPDNGLQKALETDSRYFWYFSVVCDRDDPSASVVVEGTVARVETPAALATALGMATPAEEPGLYAAAGFWHDALVASAALQPRTDTPWSALLTAVDLDRHDQRPPAHLRAASHRQR